MTHRTPHSQKTRRSHLHTPTTLESIETAEDEDETDLLTAVHRSRHQSRQLSRPVASAVTSRKGVPVDDSPQVGSDAFEEDPRDADASAAIAFHGRSSMSGDDAIDAEVTPFGGVIKREDDDTSERQETDEVLDVEIPVDDDRKHEEDGVDNEGQEMGEIAIVIETLPPEPPEAQLDDVDDEVDRHNMGTASIRPGPNRKRKSPPSQSTNKKRAKRTAHQQLESPNEDNGPDEEAAYSFPVEHTVIDSPEENVIGEEGNQEPSLVSPEGQLDGIILDSSEHTQDTIDCYKAEFDRSLIEEEKKNDVDDVEVDAVGEETEENADETNRASDSPSVHESNVSFDGVTDSVPGEKIVALLGRGHHRNAGTIKFNTEILARADEYMQGDDTARKEFLEDLTRRYACRAYRNGFWRTMSLGRIETSVSSYIVRHLNLDLRNVRKPTFATAEDDEFEEVVVVKEEDDQGAPAPAPSPAPKKSPKGWGQSARKQVKPPPGVVTDPGRFLYACGQPAPVWEGNMEYRVLVHEYEQEYKRSNQEGKDRIIAAFMDRIDFRSLKGKDWVPADPNFVKSKIHDRLTRKDYPGGKFVRPKSQRMSLPLVPKKEQGPKKEKVASATAPKKSVVGPKPKGNQPPRLSSVASGHFSSLSTAGEYVPSGKPVVFSGKGMGRNEGNLEYLEWIRKLQPEFLRCEDDDRKRIMDDIVDRFDFVVEKNGGTFFQTEGFVRSKIYKAFHETGGLKYHSRAYPPTLRTVEIIDEVPVPRIESKHLHRFMDGESPYIEELAFHYFNGPKAPTSMDQALPPPLPIPAPPSDDLTVIWTYNENTRVYLGDFAKVNVVPDVHKRFLGELMERDDITVICEGLLGGLISEESFLADIQTSFRNDPYHKFRLFQRETENGDGSFREVDGYVTMKVSDFITYLKILRGEAEGATVTFQDHLGVSHTKQAHEVKDSVFYMVDVDMPKSLFRLNEEYKHNFKMKEILPGGAWCMMNYIPEQSRPFMGPNCYVSPGGGYTQVHQDGHGTVDSGHSCLQGYNEVVMLRRLPECHKRNACRMVPFLGDCRSDTQAHNMLYRLPHDDGRVDRPSWPTQDTIKSWSAMNYCPSVFILKEGQHVLINKGRLHAFRKMTVDVLPGTDCHSTLRRDLISGLNEKRAPVCISIAFDWMFMGVSAEGINRETATSIECASICRENNCKSLAIPETALLKLAARLPGDIARHAREEPLLDKTQAVHVELRSNWKDIAKGILPSLRYVVRRELKPAAGKRAALNVSTARAPDSAFDSSRMTVDPFGNDYFCKICDHELANAYYHCEGCENLLSKDFNICSQCFNDGSFLVNREMTHAGTRHMQSNHHHVGRPNVCRGCHPTTADKCPYCAKSLSCCCCTCHKKFSKRFRFFSPGDLNEMLKQVEDTVETDEIMYSAETYNRLDKNAMVRLGEAQESIPTNNAAATGRNTRESAVFDVVMSPPREMEKLIRASDSNVSEVEDLRRLHPVVKSSVVQETELRPQIEVLGPA